MRCWFFFFSLNRPAACLYPGEIYSCSVLFCWFVFFSFSIFQNHSISKHFQSLGDISASVVCGGRGTVSSWNGLGIFQSYGADRTKAGACLCGVSGRQVTLRRPGLWSRRRKCALILHVARMLCSFPFL